MPELVGGLESVVATLRQSEERFRLLVESVKDYAIFMLDPRGIVATWNVGAERIKGYKASEIIGQSFEKFYPPDVVAAGTCAHELDVAAREGRFEEEGWRVRKDGSRFWASVVITALRDEAGALVGYAKVTRDLTDRVRAERQRAELAQVEHTAALLGKLNGVAGALGGAITPQEISTILVAQGTEALRAKTAILARPVNDTGTEELEVLATYGIDPAIARLGQRIPVESQAPLGVTYRSTTAQWAEDPDDVLARFPALAHVRERGAVAALPLINGGRVLGVVSYRFDDARRFPTDQRALLQTMAAQAASALDRADAHARERVTHDRLRVLMDLSRALSTTLTIDDVARAAIERGVQMASADTCVLYGLDQERARFVLLGERGVAPEVVEKIRRLALSGDASLDPTLGVGEAVFVETPEEYAARLPQIVAIQATGARARAYWRTPLIAEGRVIGMLGMGYFAPKTFAPAERELYAAFARQCAAAVLRATRLGAERDARARLATTLHSIGDAVVATDVAGAVTMMNPVAEALTKWPETEARGRPLADVFRIVNDDTRATVPNPVEKVLELGSVVGLANHTVLVQRDGGEIPIEDSGAPIRAEGGQVEGVVLVFRDASKQKRDEWRRTFLADATSAFSESLDYEETLRNAVRLAVPRLGDWCALDMVVTGSALPKRLAVAHTDPAKVRLATELDEKYPPDPNATTGVPNVLRTGKSELYREIPDEMLVASTIDEEHLALARDLGLRSAIIVPLVARGRILGAMSFVMAESGRRYDEDDVAFAEDLGRRLGVAIENAQLYTAEQRARRSADVANRAKDEFLAIVSHELRTPLNAILGWAKLMLAPDFDDARRQRATETIARNAVAMAQLIEDILDMSRIVTGKMRLDVHAVSLDGVIAGALDSMRPAADAKEIRVSTRIDDELPRVVGDPARLQQVVWNLLSNAVKFTPRGGSVEVEAHAIGDALEMSVRDTGVGIAARFLPYVFDAFSQEDAQTTRSRGGLGLGLAITRRLVELHGGRIEVESEGEGRGARFTVHLPVARARTIPDVPEARAPDEPSIRGARVLVVDDEPDVRELVATILDGCGCEVTVASGVDEALAAFDAQRFDVLLADIAMPGRDGFELIRRVRALPPERGGDVPAAAITANARPEDKKRILDAGFTLHVAKPLEPKELSAIVATLRQFTRAR